MPRVREVLEITGVVLLFLTPVGWIMLAFAKARDRRDSKEWHRERREKSLGSARMTLYTRFISILGDWKHPEADGHMQSTGVRESLMPEEAESLFSPQSGAFGCGRGSKGTLSSGSSGGVWHESNLLTLGWTPMFDTWW
ncbi:hypothetical protein M408DRAFT_13125 [Serendipita vermifera MAFF 305830]|uniref:Uncharacterized protein n=1 Tax=Serendipita vermifera MAFF 305830 TaxID=933852 RepID=A0A0C2WRI7_SERVB|nr:hypothetical protein M408DRAFT_13125 [Serendipita vermifera MAFF 305830]